MDQNNRGESDQCDTGSFTTTHSLQTTPWDEFAVVIMIIINQVKLCSESDGRFMPLTSTQIQ